MFTRKKDILGIVRWLYHGLGRCGNVWKGSTPYCFRDGAGDGMMGWHHQQRHYWKGSCSSKVSGFGGVVGRQSHGALRWNHLRKTPGFGRHEGDCIKHRMITDTFGRLRTMFITAKTYATWKRQSRFDMHLNFAKMHRVSLSSVSNVLGELNAESMAPDSMVTDTSEVLVEGTVHKVQYRDENSAYTVLRIKLDKESTEKVSPVLSKMKQINSGQKQLSSSTIPPYKRRRNLSRDSASHITIVGTMQKLLTGQKIRVDGTWTTHHQYGLQIKANVIEEVDPVSAENLDTVAYLSGGVLPGVGPATAKLMVETWREEIFEVLDSDFNTAMLKLRTVPGIGLAKARSIKEGWDRGQEAREASLFLRQLGMPPAISQRIAEQLGRNTAEIVSKDPYHALSSFNIPLQMVDRVAAKLNAPPDLVSRVAAVLERCLTNAAESEGHTYLKWFELEKLAIDLMEKLESNGGNKQLSRKGLLYLVAWYMHITGQLVVENETWTDEISLGQNDTNEPFLFIKDKNWDSMESLESEPVLQKPMTEDFKAIVQQRLPNVTQTQIDSILQTYGPQIIKVLSASIDESIPALRKCNRIGKKTAEKIKADWDATDRQAKVPIQAGSIPLSREDNIGIRIGEIEKIETLALCEWDIGNRCYLPALHRAEKIVAELAVEKALLSKPTPDTRLRRIRNWINANQGSDGFDLSKGQKAAIEAASDAPLLVITGGPGCGKTTVVRAIVKLWCAQGKLVRLCAPTGRAAQRMGAIQANEPSTIHRLLGYQPRGGNFSDVDKEDMTSSDSNEIDDIGSDAYFTFNRNHRLPCHAILVDEASMLNLPLAANLMEAMKPKCQLILVGDVDQLPPIGPGGFLHSLIESKIAPVIDLREVFRQEAASTIVRSALAVRRGFLPSLEEKTTPLLSTDVNKIISTEHNAFIVRAESPERIPDLVYRTVEALSQQPGFIESDLQVITPMRKGPAGSTVLNTQLQRIMNPISAHECYYDVSSKQNWYTSFRKGDRVLQLVNNYDKDVFNGDQGYIVHVSPSEKRVVVEFSSSLYSSNEDNYPSMLGLDVHDWKEGYSSDDRNGSDTSYPGDSIQKRLITYQGPELFQLELAYAITVHKSQGGEARQVVMVLSPQHGRLLTRQLLYTGLTRARELLVIVTSKGSFDPLRFAINSLGDPRHSSLTQRIESLRYAANLSAKDMHVFSNEDEVFVNQEALLSIQSNLASFPKLRELVADLGGDASLADQLSICQALIDSPAPLVSKAVVQSHVLKLKDTLGNQYSSLDINDILRTVPLMLKASPEYFGRSLSYSLKLQSVQSSDINENSNRRGKLDMATGSLVDQLCNLLSKQRDN